MSNSWLKFQEDTSKSAIFAIWILFTFLKNWLRDMTSALTLNEHLLLLKISYLVMATNFFKNTIAFCQIQNLNDFCQILFWDLYNLFCRGRFGDVWNFTRKLVNQKRTKLCLTWKWNKKVLVSSNCFSKRIYVLNYC